MVKSRARAFGVNILQNGCLINMLAGTFTLLPVERVNLGFKLLVARSHLIL